MPKAKGRTRARQAKHRVMKGDRVKVIRGNFRDAEGTVLRILPGSDRLVVEGVNMRKRHERPTQDNPEGGIITFEAPIHISNVMLVCPKCNQPSRINIQRDEQGAHRVCKKCQAIID